MRYIEFNEIYGQIGTTPGWLNMGQASALFKHGTSCPLGTKFLDVTSDPRTTALLGAVAKNVSGTVQLEHLLDPEQQPQIQLWLNRVIKLHRLTSFIAESNGKIPDFAVTRSVDVIPDAKNIFLLGQGELSGWKAVEKGPDFSVWCKS